MLSKTLFCIFLILYVIIPLLFILASKELRRVFRQGFIQRTSRCLSTLGNPPSVTTASQFTIPKGILGQPTCHTHPHMIPMDNLTCGITQAEFRERRETLVRKLAAEEENMHKTHIVSVISLIAIRQDFNILL